MLGRYVMGCRFLAEGKGQGGGNMEHGNLDFCFRGEMQNCIFGVFWGWTYRSVGGNKLGG